MTKINMLKIVVICITVFITYSFSIILMPDPPTVMDITVCEGESTLIVPSASGDAAEQQIACENFDGTDGNLGFAASVEFNDGTNDYFQATDGSDISLTSGGSYSFEDGTNIFWAAEDVDDNGGDGNVEQNITLNAIDISEVADVKFCFSIAAGNENPQNTNPGYDSGPNGDYVFVQYSVDGGAFVTGLCFAPNTGDDSFNDPLHHDVDCNGNGDDGIMLVNAAENFDFTLPAAAAAGNSVVFRILVAMSSASEEVAFDDIKVKAVPEGDITFNYYDENPDLNDAAMPVAMDMTSYDPGTTVATSPDTIWVTAVDALGESTASQVIINVLPNTDAGPNQFACESMGFEINATGDPSLVGMWTGGLGSFDDESAASTIYFPSDDELDLPVTLTYNLPGAICGESDDLIVYNVASQSASFVYPFDSICPGDGIVAPVFDEGIAGFFEVISGNETDLDLDSATGEIDLANSALGTYVIQNTVASCGNLIISGVVDGDIPGGLPKAIEFYATNDIPDLSIYGFGSANNGGGSDGEEFTFPADMVAKGDYIYLATETTQFMNFFGFNPNYVSTFAASINGDDALELFCNGVVIDVFGEIDVDGTGQAWEYTNGWAYRMSGDSINLAEFDETVWSYSGVDGLEDETDNASSLNPMPVGTFTTDFMGICPNDVAQYEFVISDFGGTMLMCPSDVVISLDGGECGVVANIVDASAVDNCSPGLELEQVEGPVTGDFLDQDNSPYIVVFEGTTDNGVLVSCSYSITIEPYTASSNTLACNGAINLSLNENCEGLITADMLLEGNDYGCYDEFLISANYGGVSVGVSVDNDFGTGNSLILDNSILNEQIEVMITDPNSGNTCWGYVTIEDKLAPVIVCPDVVMVDCSFDLTPVEPEVLDNCTDITFFMDEEINEGTCFDAFHQEIIRDWIAVDAAGNQSDVCTEIIQIERDLFSEIIFPANFDGLNGTEVLDCQGAGTEYALDEFGNPNPIGNGALIGTGEPMLGLGCSNLIIYYDDNVIPLCGNNSFKVLRDWTAIDWCSGELAEHTQIIKIQDTTAPEFTAPENVTISVDNHCRGEYQIPLIPITDDCGEAGISFDSNLGEFDNNYFKVENPILENPYTISVIGSDDCDNSDVQTFTVTFVDLVPPVILAESSLTVTLAADGTAKIFAESFDDGSYDSCGDIDFAVIRNFSTCDGLDYDEPAGDDNFQFNDVVHFCCADVGEVQMITFRVCDEEENCNTAMVEVVVQNKLPPVLVCPPAMTINCNEAAGLDLTNKELLNDLFGEPEIINSCGGTMISQAISQQDCGSGIIIRQFIALGAGQSAACAQIITITPSDENRLTCDRINYASLNNNIYDWCDVNDNNNDNDDDLPAIQIDCNEGTDIPELDIDLAGLCTEVGVNVTVDTFNFAGGACRKYLVHYEVIDQCVFDENYVDTLTGENDPYNSSNGYFEMFIEIDAFDNEGPTTDIEDITIIAEDCETADINVGLTASDNCTSGEYITYGYKIDLFSDNTIDVTDNGDYIYSTTIATGADNVPAMPVGEHTVFILLTDGCGNASTASIIVNVSANEKEPTPYCKTGFVASISAMGMVMIQAEDFNAGSFDNCTASEDLIYSFSSDTDDTERTYTCDDLGFQFITVYVTDEDGNQDFCSASFLVQDNQNFCNGSLMEGLVTSNNGYLNKDAMVMIDDVENSSYQLLTDENGMYELIGNGYSEVATVTIEDYNSALKGITAIDLLFIRKHILGIEVLPTNAQWIAADVDNNQKINGTDIIQIRKLLLGHISSFNNHMSWVAYPSTFDIESLIDPYDYPKTINLSSANTIDFTTIKVGDVNGSHTEGIVDNNEVNTRSNFKMEYETRIEDGKKVYDLYADMSELVGLDWTIKNVDLGIESDVIEISSDNMNTNDGIQKIIWTDLHNEEGVQLFSTISGDFTIEDLNSSLNSLIVLTGKGKETNEHLIQLSPRSSVSDLVSATIYPNPFSDITNVELTNFDLEKVTMEIYTIDGKLISSSVYSGVSTITIDENLVRNEGVYTIHITDGKQSVHKKLMKIK